ncbi:nucleoside triphosphate pyrophosphohydrolase [Prochlorococcus marinus]|uniref:MazG family protein n=1 Tax=Prochlorococcus marinus (strain MIT 9211) TaxID=93059 RepID=A9BDD3_PROM4|nr:nucleoside triphosphate pyrophosphohydrolase [Prochlorococcus marinus]ABX09746.1 MazG family protein [Prochlorococcus marinus str. MIT 9211]
MHTNSSNNENEELLKLIEVVSKLRDPIKGCSWDIKQTHQSLIPYVLEEAYEVADAILENDTENLCEELGDLLLQVIIHAQIASEKKLFDFNDIAKGITRKLIRRHPHIFSNQPRQISWEQIKTTEKNLPISNTPISDQMKYKIRPQPAITGAMYISQKAAKAGFEWEKFHYLWEKFSEESKELEEALNKKDMINAQEELGDVMFTLINIARWHKLNPEEGLRGTNKRFLDRFSYIESKLKGDFHNQSINKLKLLWKEAKEFMNQRNKSKNN